ncbi:hypothetical protein EJ05DRAFT_54464 [Pseudovirgaria hyperparasitica]|uniref:Uncharacterized protein n=1 Tax=Pseudovirgaria hyperparasitica TaxID=470096 RepID=A0A6A6W4G4_9PEZI|nr:uncharacterized protein EJ05DRAFT_54464 [Pseudovirgaria hyperparasitica]KAF2757059.1 hypothetical protein EJ05DRAFT_54464 [Pseudovirgaria hyperparasitica]
MRCFEAGSDRSAEVWIAVNGEKRREYNSRQDDEDDALCCFVPVNNSENLAICVDFTGPTNEYYVDIFVDGLLRNCVKKKKTSKEEHYFDAATAKKPAILCSSGLSWNGNQLYECPMKVVALTRELVADIDVHGSEDIGVIEIRLSVLRRGGERYKLDTDEVRHAFQRSKASCPERKPVATNRDDLDPTHEIEFTATAEGSKSRTSKNGKLHVNKLLNNHRPGALPWAIFKFYYRSQGELRLVSIGPSTNPFESDEIERTLDFDVEAESIGFCLAVDPVNISQMSLLKTNNGNTSSIRAMPALGLWTDSIQPQYLDVTKESIPSKLVSLDAAANERSEIQDGRASSQAHLNQDGDSRKGDEPSSLRHNYPLAHSTVIVERPSTTIEALLTQETAVIENIVGPPAACAPVAVMMRTHSLKPAPDGLDISRQRTDEAAQPLTSHLKRTKSELLSSIPKRTRTETSESERRAHKLTEKRQHLAEQIRKTKQSQNLAQKRKEAYYKKQEEVDNKELAKLDDQLKEALEAQGEYDREIAGYEASWKELTDSEMEA